MRPVDLETNDASGDEQVTSVCPLDTYIRPFQVTLKTIVTGTVEYTVEYTEDRVFDANFDPDAANWLPIFSNEEGGNMFAATDNAEATLISTVTGVRMRQTAGNGSVLLQIRQAGAV